MATSNSKLRSVIVAALIQGPRRLTVALGQVLLACLLMAGMSCAETGVPREPSGSPREVADAFVQALLSDQWREASAFASSASPAVVESLEDIHRSLARDGVRLAGPPRREGNRFIYPTFGETFAGQPPSRITVKGALDALLAVEDGAWVVVEYGYRADVKAEQS
jgi:hypothetical protein